MIGQLAGNPALAQELIEVRGEMHAAAGCTIAWAFAIAINLTYYMTSISVCTEQREVLTTRMCQHSNLQGDK